MRKLVFIVSLLIIGITYSQENTDVSVKVNAEITVTGFEKAPYLLFTGENTEMLIVWQMLKTIQCKVDWGTDFTYASGTQTTNEYGTAHQHKIVLQGLTPATKYFYRITSDEAELKTGNFYSGVADTATVVSFYAYGDTRTNPATHNAVAKKIMEEISRDPNSQSFIITSGDFVQYGDKESSWTTEFFDLKQTSLMEMLSKLPYLGSMGNHEGQGKLFAKYFPYPMYTTGRYYYSFDYGPVHFTVMDQYISYSKGSEQYTWMENDLAASSKPWKIILNHEPAWTATPTSGGHANNATTQAQIQPLCLKYGVQFVISGHNHFYSRADVENVMHITTGGGGAPLYEPADRPYIVKKDKSNHFCKLDIDKNMMKFTAERSNGTIIESINYVNTNTSGVISVKQNKLAESFTTFTNKGSITLLNKEHLKGSYIVYDNWGKTMIQNELSGDVNQVSLKEPGVYYIRINIDDSFIVKKVILDNN